MTVIYGFLTIVRTIGNLVDAILRYSQTILEVHTMGKRGVDGCHKKKLTTRVKKAKNHFKLFTHKKNVPSWELLLEEYKLLKNLT